MLASFVIGFHTARIDNLLQTLRFLTTDHADVVRECYAEIHCQDNDESLPPDLLEQLDTIRECFKGSCISSFNLKHMHLPYLTNRAVESAPTDKIIILESDRLLPAGYFAHVIQELRPGVQISSNTMFKLTAPMSDDDIRARKFMSIAKLERRSETNEIGQRNMWSGNTAICKRDYFKAGKMDEAYTGYGWADSDMTNATANAGIISVFKNYDELHLWHPSATYGEGDQKSMFINNGLHFCKKWGVPTPIWFREEIAKHRGIML